MRASLVSFFEVSDILRRFGRVTIRSPVVDIGVHRARNSMKTVSKEGKRSNASNRAVVSSRTLEPVLRVSEVTEGKMCCPEKEEISSTKSVLREGKDPPRKAGGMSNMCMEWREWILSALRDGAGSTRCSAICSIWD